MEPKARASTRSGAHKPQKKPGVKKSNSASAARRAQAKKRRQVRRIALAASAFVCAVCLVSLLLLNGGTDKSRVTAMAPEAVIAAQPIGDGAVNGVQVAHANKPIQESKTPVPTLETTEAPVENTQDAVWAMFDDLDVSESEQPFLAPEPTSIAGRILQEMGVIVDEARVTNKEYKYEQKLYQNGKEVSSYSRSAPIVMGSSAEYAEIEGVLTFRGNNYRDSAAYGTIPNDANKLSVAWTKRIGGIDKWTGVGWTGQASIVRWPDTTLEIMNINEQKKSKDGLKEVIYATLDGNIYFLDLDDGEATRGTIRVPSSIKGSVTVDPRGYPLLYCGQGIPEVNGSSVKIGTRVFSLIDQSVLLFLNGRDDYCLRRWYAFDCAPLVDAESDTMLQLGENGIFYSVTLNTDYDPDEGTISIDPVIDRMVYKSAVSTRMGMENSLSVYNHYAYYTDNSGLLTCLDLNTLETVWLRDVGDDSDASIVIEEDENGVWLYQTCELDLNGLSGDCYCRKYNALTGEEMWRVAVDCRRPSEDIDAGGFATPAVGKGELKNLVYYNICRVREGGGTLLAIDKDTGDVVWTRGTGGYSWSSPTCVYDGNGRGYLILGNSKGVLRLLDGLTGEEIASVELDANIEGSPAIFNDMLVIGTRGGRIYGVKISSSSL